MGRLNKTNRIKISRAVILPVIIGIISGIIVIIIRPYITDNRDKEKLENYFKIGIFFLEAGKLTEAQDQFLKIFNIPPNEKHAKIYARAYIYHSWIDYKGDDFTGALIGYNQAISVDSNSAEAYCNRGILYLEQYYKNYYNKYIEQSDPDVLSKIEQNPKDDLSDIDLSDIIKDFSKAIELNPNYINIFTKIGTCLLEKSHECLLQRSPVCLESNN